MKIIKLFFIWMAVAGFAASLHAQTTQQVTAIQYYYNTDPGVGNAGNGAVVSVTPAAIVDQVFSFNLPTALTEGFHYLYIRAQDENGRWSLTERRMFVIQSITATENITDYAYYFDTDPGVGNPGNGAIVPVAATANFTTTVAITVPPSLSEGFHYLYVRARDLSGQWSLTERRLFVIQSITATENITDYAYYFDTDPGVGNPGNGAIVPVTPTANFSATVAITIPASLPDGFHYLYVRTRDESGQWSLTERRLFVTQAITPAEDITALEWYLDNDPGVGNANPYPITTTGEFNATIDLGGVPCTIPTGTRYLYVRAKNTAGRWSIIERLALDLVAPEINVLGNAITIADGDATPDAADGTDFGQPLPLVPVTHTFTIENNGTAPLTISSLSMSGTDPASFTIAGITTPLTLAIAGSTSFTVSFAAAPVGNYNAILNINSDDCDEALYDFALHGEVSCQPAAFSVCPANINENNTPGQCGAAVTYTATVTGDPAPVVSYTFSGATTGSGSGTGSGSTFNKGVTTVTINATNACGNVNCSFTVTVVDNEAPVPDVTNLPNITGECGATATAPTATDNCAGAITGTTTDPVSYTAQGTYTITWTYDDGNGNPTTQTQSVIVADMTDPVITCPANTIISYGSNESPAANGTASATDNCAGVSVGSHTDATIPGPGNNKTITRTWTATDIASNIATCSQTITVCDMGVSLGNNRFVFFGVTGLPGATADITATISGGLTGVTYLWSSTNASVNGLTTQTVTPTGYADAEAVTYTVTATAPNGCTATASVTITYFNINCSTNGNNVKVRVCHIPQGNPSNCKSICVSINAYQTLLDNGSYLGYCLPNCALPPIGFGDVDIDDYIVKPDVKEVVKLKDGLFDVKVFNNPTSSTFVLKVSGTVADKVSIRIMDMNGVLVEQRTNLNAGQEIRIGDSYISGSYFAEVTQGANRKVVKLVKLN